jgi:hypothetical protein
MKGKTQGTMGLPNVQEIKLTKKQNSGVQRNAKTSNTSLVIHYSVFSQLLASSLSARIRSVLSGLRTIPIPGSDPDLHPGTQCWAQVRGA